MPKWISIEIKDADEPKTPPVATTVDTDETSDSGTGSSAGAWIASIVVTLLILVVAGAAWYFAIRPNRAQAITSAPSAGVAPGAAPAGVGVPAPLDDLPAVVAKVNSDEITREQLTQLIRINQALYPLTNGSEVVLDTQTLFSLRASLLEQMVNNRIEINGAKAAGVQVSDSDLETEYANFKNVYKIDDAKLDPALAKYGLTSTDIKNWLRDSILVNRFLAAQAQQASKTGQTFSLESWLNDQLITADVQTMLPGMVNNTPLKVGEAPPNFTLKDVDGKTYTLSDLKGKPVIVNFWATWCAPCKFEMPHFEKTYQKYKDQGLVILAVDIKTDNGEQAVRKYISELGMSFPILMDGTGQTEQDYRVRAYPTTYFIGRDGKLREVRRGAFLTPEQISLSVDKIMQQ